MRIVETWRIDQVHTPSVFVDERMNLDFRGTWTCKPTVSNRTTCHLTGCQLMANADRTIRKERHKSAFP
jgi:hypothetical protein